MSAATGPTCGSCGEQLPAGRRFCIHCGAPQRLSCAACGAAIDAGARFCGECGTPLAEAADTPVGPAIHTGSAAAAPARGAERRLVSVLFADLVGFTTLSEHRDPEAVRELLSSYFDRCRTLIERHGGTVEKFIGDAVMAVWGTPVAREDDPERAVRAALALTQAVSALGEEVGMPELRVRAGVLTGNAAVDLGAEREGMVLGDTVNTASRLQSLAKPGTVLVDDATHRASEAAIAYEDAGSHHVKGRERPVRAWTALRVVAGAGGARRGAGLEAPFVGRERELRAMIEAGEASAQQRHARLVAVVGEAGSGKSRLLWEFWKHLDGVEDVSWWHQGRCLSYGEGVAYWALAEMVRSRARIEEEEDPRSAREKLRAVVAEHVTDDRERRLVEPRLAHLLRLEERPEADRVDLFSGWRLFFERMAASNPVILAFEDLQWADGGLLDFIDYLLEWSAEYPIFVIALGRPELRERRPSWEPLTLSAIEPEQIREMLEGLAPGLPDELVTEIVSRAEGIPLYAVEMVRMLQDRGLLVQEGSRYLVTGDVTNLDVPETLHALVASRLDGLSEAERLLLQDAAVLGQSFTASAVAALSGAPEQEVEQMLAGLVIKQVLSRDDDPRSPDRGQYVFLQALLRTVAYGTLSRRTRKARHVAAARHLEQTWPGESRDIAEVLASHYLEAINAEPDAEDVAELRASARTRLAAAGQAAASLGLGPEAQRYLDHAAELTEDPLERAALLEQAGRALRHSGDAEGGEHRLRSAIDLYRGAGVQNGGRAAVELAFHLRQNARIEEARALLERFRSDESPAGDPIVHAEALAELGALLTFTGEVADAGPLFDKALMTLEEQQAWPALANALVNRAIYLLLSHRLREGAGVLREALQLAEERDLPATALRARINLTQVSLEQDRFGDALEAAREGQAIARERGDKMSESFFSGQLVPPLFRLGRWSEAAAIAAPQTERAFEIDAIASVAFTAQFAAARGDGATLERCVELAADHLASTYVDVRFAATTVHARNAIEQGEPREAVGLARSVLGTPGVSSEFGELVYEIAVEAALAADDPESRTELVAFVDALPPAVATPLLRSGRARLLAESAHRSGDPAATQRHEDEAITTLRSVGERPMLASALLDQVRRHGDGDALAEVRTIYGELGADSWLERLDERQGVAS